MVEPKDKITKKDILELIEIDPDARAAFLAMERKEQLLVILSGGAFVRNEIAKLWQAVNRIDGDLVEYKKETRKERDRRNKREAKLNDLLDSAPEIKNMTDDEKNSLTEKILAITSSRRIITGWQQVSLELIKLAVMIVTIIGTLKGVGVIGP